MTIHELNCATLHPRSRRLVNGEGSLIEPARLVCRGLLVSADGDEWILIDTGLGVQDCIEPQHCLGRRFLMMTQQVLDSREAARAQVVSLGIAPESVQDIILRHIDCDHVGGISDFPCATIYLSAGQYGLMRAPQGKQMSARLHSVQWEHHPGGGPSS
ncbi:MBL fold metallo-hydrolase [Actinomyces bowdenii]|uniref:MBL fold metallo-hydrolase n=1 Tax=Actinomyces bowdenii TaxID=131109 RepID=UPI0035A3363B